MGQKEWKELLDREQFVVGESSMNEFVDNPYRLDFGANILCLSGEAEFSVDMIDHLVKAGTGVFVLPNNLLNIRRLSPDFRVTYFLFSGNLFHEATFRLDSSLFKYLADHPFFDHDERTVVSIRHWMQMAEYTYKDRENIHRIAITRNRLQNVFLEIHDKIRRGQEVADFRKAVTSRRSELFHRFMDLLRNNCCQQRDVGFYADKLCITPRYLSSITHSVLGRSAKELIDYILLSEIKMRLRSTDMSVQEIAYELHFPDQSYLGRFFKRHTGQSPTDYRASGLSL